MMKIPMFLRLALLHHLDDDMVEHEISIEVAGARESRVQALIRSEFYRDPQVVEIADNGMPGIKQVLLERLLILSFRLLSSEMVEECGWECRWSMPDVTTWLSCQFGAPDAEAILAALRPHVRPNVQVRNVVALSIG